MNDLTKNDDFDFIEDEEGTSVQKNDKPFGEKLTSFQPENIGDFTSVYKKHHGSSTRFPGGNCILESVLTYMSNEQIQRMINTVDNVCKQEKLNGEDNPYREDIDKIFENTPLSRYALLSAYMRSYIYLYCKVKEEKDSKLPENEKQNLKINTSELTSGKYITPNAHVLGAIGSMTDCDVFRIGIGKNQPSILVSRENKTDNEKMSINENVYYTGSEEMVDSVVSSLIKGNEASKYEDKSTIKPAEYNGKKIIPLFFKGAHCEPCVSENEKGMHANIDMKLFDCDKKLNSRKGKWIAVAVIGLGLAAATVASIFFFPIMPLIAAISVGAIAAVTGSVSSIVAAVSNSRSKGSGIKVNPQKTNIIAQNTKEHEDTKSLLKDDTKLNNEISEEDLNQIDNGKYDKRQLKALMKYSKNQPIPDLSAPDHEFKSR